MKTISLLLAASCLLAPAVLRAQDAATEERLNKLSAQIQDLAEARDAQNRKIEQLTKAIEAMQQKLNTPNSSYASQEDLKQVADKLREVDQKRKEDDEAIIRTVERELKTLGNALRRPTVSTAPTTAASSDRGYEYVVKPTDTLSAIAAAYRAEGVKVTVEDIQKANPGLVPERMPVGTKIFIPAPR
jgi:LysM repeat protein